MFFVCCGYKQASHILILAAVRKQTHQKSDYHIKQREIKRLLPVLEKFLLSTFIQILFDTCHSTVEDDGNIFVFLPKY